MSIIHSHHVKLTAVAGTCRIVLRPITDDDIPLLCALNSDPEALRWADDNAEPYDEARVKGIWGYVSPMAYCFIVEADDVPIGDCWLQRMNLPEIQSLYPKGTDVRRIDMSIGKTAYWNRGIGTTMIRCLTDFAFREENVDVLHCMCNEENIRSVRVWEKNGFRLKLQKPREGTDRFENHYVLTRETYFANQME